METFYIRIVGNNDLLLVWSPIVAAFDEQSIVLYPSFSLSLILTQRMILSLLVYPPSLLHDDNESIPMSRTALLGSLIPFKSSNKEAMCETTCHSNTKGRGHM